MLQRLVVGAAVNVWPLDVPQTPLPTLAQYVAFLKGMGTAADPMAFMASLGLTVESYVECVTLWGEVLSRRDDLALRYARLAASG